MLKRKSLLAVGAIGMVLPAAAHAHPGHSDGGFASGFIHPFGGLDHILVMILVGLVAARSGGRTLIVLPATFIGAMVLGSLSGIIGADIPLVEMGIAASLVVFGVCATFDVRIPALLGGLATALFAFFHGQAHGAELPATVAKLPYVAGFVMATATLHLAAIAVWMSMSRHDWRKLAVRTIGTVSMLLGTFMVAALA